MKQKILMCSVLASLLLISIVGANSDYPEITEQTCDACSSCPEGLVCLNFMGIGSRCAEPDPCSYYCKSKDYKCNPPAQIQMAQICDDGTSVTVVPVISCQCVGSNCTVIIGGEENTITIKNPGVIDRENPGGIEGEYPDAIDGNYPDDIGIIIIDDYSIRYRYGSELEIVDSKLYMKTSGGNKQINVLPKDAVSVSGATESVKSIELGEEGQKPIYSIEGKKRARLFAVIPMKMKFQARVDASNGNVISINKPWWGFLASE